MDRAIARRHADAALLCPPPDLSGYVDLAGHDGPQLFVPAVTIEGDLCLQPGESIVTTFDTIGAGTRSGLSPARHGGGSMEEMDGRCFVTSTRVVFVGQWWHRRINRQTATARSSSGTQHRTTAASTRPLVAQARWPWLTSLSYTRGSRSIGSLVEFRCAQSNGYRAIDLFLSVVPGADVDVDHVVRTIVDSVQADRLGHDRLEPEHVIALSELEPPAANSGWRTVCLPGAYKRMASTAAYGRHSAATLSAWRESFVDRMYA